MTAIFAVAVSTFVGISAAAPASALSAGIPFAAEASPTWQANNLAYAVASTGGVVAVGGSFTRISPPAGGSGTAQNRTALALFNADTGNPTSCQFTVTASSGTASIRAITPATSGNVLYIGGNFTAINGTTRNRLAAINPVTCTLVSTFNPNVGGMVRSIFPAPNGTLYFGGEFGSVAGSTRYRVAAVNASTGALTPFNPVLRSDDVLDPNNPRITVLPVTAALGFALSPDGSNLVMGGEFDYVNETDSHALAVLDPTTGALKKSYPKYDRVANPSGFFNNNDAIKTVTSDASGFYIGSEGAGVGSWDGRAALDWSSLNLRWKDTCNGATQDILLYNNVLYGASHAHDCSSIGGWQGDERQHFTAQPTDAANFNKFYGWFPDTNEGTGEGIGPRGIDVATGSSGNRWFWAVGEFTKVNGANQQAITRFGTTDSNAPAAPSATAQALVAGQIQIRFRTVVDSDDSLLTYRVYRNGSSTPMWTGTASSVFWTRPQVTVVDSSVTAGTNYSYRVTATDATGNVSALSGAVSATASATGSAYASAVLANSPSLYWRYDEASGAWLQDKSGATTTGINGLYGGGVTRSQSGAIAGDSSTSATFDGSTGYVWEDQFTRDPSTYTTETWFRTSTTRGGVLISYGNQRQYIDTGNLMQSFTFDHQVFMSDDGRLNYGVFSGSARTLQTSASYNDNRWHHVVASLGAGGMQLYVDGALAGSNAQVTSNSRDFNGVWHVGFDGVGNSRRPFWAVAPTSPYFAGSIDETAVYPTQLSAAQVANHYAVGSGGSVAPDTVAPTTPGTPTATVTGSSVALGWTASTDAVGVTGYRVYRGTTTGFTPTAGNLIGTVTTNSYTDSGVAAGTWFYKVVAFDGANNSSSASGSGTATVAQAADSTAPSVPGSVTASAAGSTVNVGWAAATDNVGVTGYQVHRGTSAGFTTSAGSLVGTVTGTTFANTGLAAGTYYYKVIAVDAAGNASAASAAASATVAGGGGSTTTQTVAPIEDTMVASNNAAFVYGGTNQLSSRGTVPLESYLKFALPSLPAGATLTGATLTVRTSDDGTAASADSHLIRLLNGSWSEASTTWNNRPTGLGATVGTITGATSLNTAYNVQLDPAQLAGLLGTTASVAITSTGGDNIRIWSKEASATYRPSLTLTFTQ
ncbi:hypothetical protein DDQ50_05350 [Amnibacterium flavum]|uniref:Fibronectin type-III domain-containing protein n=2 Tax=Amnibacterium flavum TaxID=2173173 RepID=A0A2V1HVU3_9MICO|nr:hypothetical protein DDQ50_05350 [Amnibacterium flavum]